MKEKRNSRIHLFALLVLVFTLGFGFSVDTSKQSLAVPPQVAQADENNGILAFNGQKAVCHGGKGPVRTCPQCSYTVTR